MLSHSLRYYFNNTIKRQIEVKILDTNTYVVGYVRNIMDLHLLAEKKLNLTNEYTLVLNIQEFESHDGKKINKNGIKMDFPITCKNSTTINMRNNIKRLTEILEDDELLSTATDMTIH